MTMEDELRQKQRIRELLESWVVWSDSGDWERFRSLWHEPAYMFATWFQAPAQDFVNARRDGWNKGVSIIHHLGSSSIDLAGTRAIAQTRMVISQRAPVEGVLCDVNCTGRFYDFLEERKGKWGLVLRRPIYEKDRIDPVEPGAKLALDPKILAEFPDGYRHLAYMQHQMGYKVKRDMPGLKGAEVERLYARGKAWLEGKPIEFD